MLGHSSREQKKQEENGVFYDLRPKNSGRERQCVTLLFYRPDQVGKSGLNVKYANLTHRRGDD